MKHAVKGYVTVSRYAWNDHKPIVNFMPWKPEETHELAIVGEQSFEVEVPDDFNPIPQQVAALEEKKRQLRLKLAEDLAALDENLSKLTCITFEAA